MEPASDSLEPLALPVDGMLDLHTFKPAEIKELLPDYFAACREKGIFEVRVIHGKGIGQLRRSVHAILARLPEVASFAQASEIYGGWGATIVRLKPPPQFDDDKSPAQSTEKSARSMTERMASLHWTSISE